MLDLFWDWKRVMTARRIGAGNVSSVHALLMHPHPIMHPCHACILASVRACWQDATANIFDKNTAEALADMKTKGIEIIQTADVLSKAR